MNPIMQHQALFNQFVDFILQKNVLSVGEIQKSEPMINVDQEVRSLEISYENDSSVSVKLPGKQSVPYDCRHLGFRDSRAKAWRYFIDILSNDGGSFNFGPAYEYPEGDRLKRVKVKHYDAQWKLCDEVSKKLLSFFEKEFGWRFSKGHKLYEKIATGPDGERRFKFRVKNSCFSEINKEAEDCFSELDEIALISEINELNNEFSINPECEDDVSSRLVLAVKTGQRKYGWSDDHMMVMVTG
jgi:hypothetical protein